MNEFGRTFDDYKVVIIDIGRVSKMAPKLGRIYKCRTTIMVGNCAGFYGFATAQTDEATEGIKEARAQAFRNLEYHRLHENRTIEADVYHHYHKTALHLLKQPEGYGIR